MRVLLQRVSEASVSINGSVVSEIQHGLCILLGIAADDDLRDIDWLCKKICALRIFNDEAGKMNLSLADVRGEVLVVSQFTLHSSTKKGNRPSFISAAKPDKAIPLYETFVSVLREQNQGKVVTGEFGADMSVALVNDGPVTIWIDSRDRQ